MAGNPGYFSNHSQTRLTTSSAGTNSSSSPVSTTPIPGGNNGNPLTGSNSRSRSTSGAVRSNSKHFSLSVSGTEKTGSDKGRGTSADRGSNGEEGIKRITSFSSVETFWTVFTHLNPPSNLQPTTDYLVFHSGIHRPVWEDPMNVRGGKWSIRLRKGVADRLWEDLILALIGDQYEDEDEVCGCVLSVRTQEDIISVWNKDESNSQILTRIRETTRRVLNLTASAVFEYKSHNGTD
ncbi:hypothetical protein FRC10_010967 [Ceratobasidium sp. 414]|nr:hypothetical protein FRC10_010967 [Ceratobasidium sp. 414]